VFSALHELLVDHFASIVGSSLDVDGLFDDGVRAAAECLSSSVLWTRNGEGSGLKSRIVKRQAGTWQGTVCVGGMMLVSSACGCDWNRD
jgi:hypothetical protein